MENKKGINRVGLNSFAVAIIAMAWLFLPLRIASPELNQLFSLFAIWCVFISFGVAGACIHRRTWLRVVASAPFVLISVLFPLAMIMTMIAGGPIIGYEVVDSVKLPHSTVTAYRTNGGATTAFGIQIVQEMSVFPGIIIVKDLYNGYHEDTATIKFTQPNTVLATINEKPVTFEVRPFIYF